MSLRVRLTAVAVGVVFLGVAFGIRLVVSGGGILDGSGALAQYSGTALYAATVYAGVFVLAPRTRPWVAGAVAVGFCWAVEFFQLTPVPAALSERSIVARLVLGAKFDTTDLAWYVIGVGPLVGLHEAARRWTRRNRR